MITLGQNSISDLRLGDSQVQAAYLGNEQIWHREQPAGDYWGLCFTAEEPNASISMVGNGTPPVLNLLYSTNANTWSTFTPGTTTVTLANVGDKVWFKAGSGGNNGTGSSALNYWKFSFINHVAASGNIMSLLNGEQETYVISQDYAFSCLFQQTNIIHAAELQLPATPLTAQGIYYDMFYQCSQLVSAPDLQAEVVTGRNCCSGMFSHCTSLSTPPQIFATAVNSDQGPMQQMFRGCTSLTSAPALPAMALGSNCYSQMFRGCTSLSSAPELPATALRYSCYSQMFYGCTALTAAPALPATTLTGDCYYNMFSGCTKLASISASFTQWNPSNATTGWVTNVSSSGTFYCPTALGTNDTITRGDNNCPTNWTVVNKTYFRYSDGTSYTHDINGTLTRQAVLDSIAQDNQTSGALRYVYMGSDITAVAPSAFSDWSYLRGIVIGENVEIVDDNAFRRDASISSITFAGDSLTAIGPYGFAGVQNTGRYDLPEGLQTIGNNAFVYGGSAPNGLSVVSIPSTVTSIGGSAFSNSNALLSVIFNGKTMNEVTAMSNYPWGASGKIFVN